MKPFKILAMFIVILSAGLAMAQKGEGYGMGNGGGVICINGVCKTLTESGLIVNTNYPNFWLPESNLLDELNKQINILPLYPETRGNLLSRILLKLKHFKKVDIVDQSKVDIIIKNYKDTILATNPKLDLSNFEVVAFSSDDTASDPNTFLLPSFFRLSDKSKAKILIHEGMYRGQKNSALKQVLQIDSALSFFDIDNLKIISDVNLLKYNTVSLQIALYNLGILRKNEFLGQVLVTTFSNALNYYVDNNYQNYDIANIEDASGFGQIFNVDGYVKGECKVMISTSNLFGTNVDSRIKVLVANLSFMHTSHCQYMSLFKNLKTYISVKNNNIITIENLNYYTFDIRLDDEVFILPN